MAPFGSGSGTLQGPKKFKWGHDGVISLVRAPGGSGQWAIRRLLPASVPLSRRGGGGGEEGGGWVWGGGLGGQLEGGGGSRPLHIWCEMAVSSHWAEMLHHPCILGDPQREGDKIRIGGAHKWAEMLHHPCILGDPQREGDKIRIGGAHKWAEMLHHQGGQNQNWMPQPCLLGAHKWAQILHFRGSPTKGTK